MLTVDGLNIQISHGDTAQLTYTFESDAPDNGTVAIFTVKRGAVGNEEILRKESEIIDGIVTFILEHEDTDIPFGSYQYDIRCLYENGDVYTPMPPCAFDIVEVIGNGERS